MDRRSSAGSDRCAIRTALLAGQNPQDQQTIADLVAKLGWQFSLADDENALRCSLEERPFCVVIAREECFGLPAERLLSLIAGVRPDQAILVIGSATEFSSSVSSSPQIRYLNGPLSESVLHDVLSEMSICLSKPSPMNDSREVLECTSLEMFNSGVHPKIFEELRKAFEKDQTVALQVELAFQEALANAFEHGNLELKSEWREEVDAQGIDRFSKMKEERLRDSTYADRLIQIFFEMVDGKLSIEIQDSGPGFDVKKRRTVQDDGTVKCHGRGLTLMELVMDEVKYSDNGRRIHLSKNLIPS
ncbi:MAG: ATP-binding protein [Bdellovibrionales bacterium]|nr:ATP-binding protein [Bdellovibrionales bacterium]